MTRDVSARSLLAHLYCSALEPHAQVDVVRDVRYQILGGSREFGSDLTRRERLVQANHSWDLILSVHRPFGGSSTGKPTIQLQCPRFKLSECTIISSRGRWCPHIQLLIVAHLKTDVVAANHKDAPSGGQRAEADQALRGVVKQLIVQTANSVKHRVFDDMNDLLLGLRDSLLRWLPSSAIAAFADFNDLEITLSEDSAFGRRYVSSTILNADGSKRAVRLPKSGYAGLRMPEQSDYQHQTISLTFAEDNA